MASLLCTSCICNMTTCATMTILLFVVFCYTYVEVLFVTEGDAKSSISSHDFAFVHHGRDDDTLRRHMNNNNVNNNNSSANSTVGSIFRFRLIDANMDLPMRFLANNIVYNLYNAPTQNFNIEVTTSGVVGSVLLTYNNISYIYQSSDSTLPFTLCGDTTITTPTSTMVVDYASCTFLSAVGRHTITATPYMYANLSGTVGISQSVTFTVSNRKTNTRCCCTTPKVWNYDHLYRT
jgi:hypothetical protein